VRRELRAKSGWHSNKAFRVNETELLELSAHVHGGVKDHGGFLQSAQNAPRHGPEPAGPGFFLRSQQTAESIEIVTEDARLLPRQLMDQVGVTVVAQVKQLILRS
jgi:hypothetical protein